MIYKQSHSEWCQTCVNGPKPNDDCRMCHITHVRPGSGPSIGQPANWVEAEVSTDGDNTEY